MRQILIVLLTATGGLLVGIDLCQLHNSPSTTIYFLQQLASFVAGVPFLVGVIFVCQSYSNVSEPKNPEKDAEFVYATIVLSFFGTIIVRGIGFLYAPQDFYTWEVLKNMGLITLVSFANFLAVPVKFKTGNHAAKKLAY